MIESDKYVKKNDSKLPGYCGMAPVHFAARYGKYLDGQNGIVKTVGFLMDQMENPHQQDEFGNTVLHHSVLNWDERTRYLCKLNA